MNILVFTHQQQQMCCCSHKERRARMRRFQCNKCYLIYTQLYNYIICLHMDCYIYVVFTLTGRRPVVDVPNYLE